MLLLNKNLPLSLSLSQSLALYVSASSKDYKIFFMMGRLAFKSMITGWRMVLYCLKGYCPSILTSLRGVGSRNLVSSFWKIFWDRGSFAKVTAFSYPCYMTLMNV